ncbi:putative acetyl xylan esterase [Lunatimonas lonarensis]|uniref:Putative acetyl xylan esterase n=1 Tax=Lunatimonas lonarensis TaxID=1232681 RepID=R7ZW22_9BACT|nr:putative acetyl xylan esterase [Lunatimonas lonarensis]EON78194.1 putative acetyl xylan esterase [Lunatimonas lonarensis]
MQYPIFPSFFCLIALWGTIHLATAQHAVFNYEEAKVPSYSLPDPFVSTKGKPISSIDDWNFVRRPEIIRLFEDHVYGQVPKDLDGMTFTTVNLQKDVMDGRAVLKEVDVLVSRKGNSLTMRLTVFVPSRTANTPSPVFLLITHRSPDNIDPTRMVKSDFWPAEMLIERGYAVAAFHVQDVSDDNKETFREDILETLYPEQLAMANGMRGLGAWAWGAMRAMDYFVQDPDIDEKRAAVVGHSRGGKAALWTGAQDTRWAITISNESGCGGAALSRRRFGETVTRINTNFPYWFTDNFERYSDNEDALPVDQHMLIASIAPRAVYVASAQDDQWADPRGEYLSLLLGSRVHKSIYNFPYALPDEPPAVNNPIHLGPLGYHMREGAHNLTAVDWANFLDFADKLYQR